MTLRLTGSLSQFERFARTADRRYRKAVEDGLRRGGERGLALLKMNISRGDVVDTGDMRNSCEFDRKAMLLGVAAPHGAFLEVGTRPHMPPIEPLVEWAKRKFSPNRRKRGGKRKPARKKGFGERIAKWAKKNLLVNLSGMYGKGAGKSPGRILKPELTDKQARAIAWRVALSIKKRGTKPRFYMRKTVHELKPRILPEFRRAMLKADKRAMQKTQP